MNDPKKRAVGNARTVKSQDKRTSDVSREQPADLRTWAEKHGVTRTAPLRASTDSAEGGTFAFYGRAGTRHVADAAMAWERQRRCAQSLISPSGGQIVEEYFDIGVPRSTPWRERPRAGALLSALADPSRGFEAVVLGDTYRAFTTGQFEWVFPHFTCHRVPLWIPELGSPIHDGDPAHQLVMEILTAGLHSGPCCHRPCDAEQEERS